MNYIEINEILDTLQFGDRLAVTRANGGIAATVAGPVLLGRSLSLTVGIDLLDGEPHIVRNYLGQIVGHIVSIEVNPEGTR